MHKLYTNHTKHLAILLALLIHVMLLVMLFYQAVPSLHPHTVGQEDDSSTPAKVSFGNQPKATQSLDNTKTSTRLAKVKKPKATEVLPESQSIDSTPIKQVVDLAQPTLQAPAPLPEAHPEVIQSSKTGTDRKLQESRIASPNPSLESPAGNQSAEDSYGQARPLPLSPHGTHAQHDSQGQEHRTGRHRTNRSGSRSSGTGSLFQDFANAMHSANKANAQAAKETYQEKYGNTRGNVSEAQIAQVEKQAAQFRYLAYNSNAHKILRTTFNIYRTEIEVPYDISTAVDITVTIDGDGKVLESTIIPSLNMPEVERSIIETIRKAHFSALPKNFNSTRHTFSEHVTVNLHKGMCRIICS